MQLFTSSTGTELLLLLVAFVRYDDGSGVLRSILSTATAMGFRGRPPLQNLVLALDELDGVTGVRLRTDDDD